VVGGWGWWGGGERIAHVVAQCGGTMRRHNAPAQCQFVTLNFPGRAFKVKRLAGPGIVTEAREESLELPINGKVRPGRGGPPSPSLFLPRQEFRQ
jgi:hypothetical protein